MIKLISGSMYSSKSAELIKQAERAKLMRREILVFHPQSCSNGVKDAIESRANLTLKSAPIQEPIDIYNHLRRTTDDVFIDEFQFLCNSKQYVEDMLNLIKYFEKKKINLYLAGLPTDFRGVPFEAFKEIAPYATEIQTLTAVCQMCYNDKATRSLRMRDGKPCSFDEDVLISRENENVEYYACCAKCFYEAYGI